jgi:hypothetical protein
MSKKSRGASNFLHYKLFTLVFTCKCLFKTSSFILSDGFFVNTCEYQMFFKRGFWYETWTSCYQLSQTLMSSFEKQKKCNSSWCKVRNCRNEIVFRQRNCKDSWKKPYKSMDEKRLRWLVPGLRKALLTLVMHFCWRF